MHIASRIMPRVLLIGALLAGSAPIAAQDDIETFFRAFTDEWVAMNPNLAVSAGYFDGERQTAMERRLTPVSRQHRLALHGLARDGLAHLDTYERGALTEKQRLAADVFRAQLESMLSEEPWLDYILFPLDPMLGANAEIPSQFIVTHPLESPQDARNYVARLGEVDERMAEAVAEARRRAELGIMPPAFILRGTIAQLQRFISQPTALNPLVGTLRTKTMDITTLSEAERTELVGEATRVVDAEIYPAWYGAIEELQRQLPLAGDEAGLWRFEHGDEIYANQLRVYTTTDLSAARIHAIGLAEVARIEAEMDTLFRQLGLETGSIAERTAILSERMAWPGTEEGRRQMQDFIDATLSDAKIRAATLFNTMPRSPVEARPYPQFLWNDAAASYTPPPLDGSRPGVFQYPLRPSYLTEFSLRSLVYHETVPGHHFQIAMTAEDPDLPRFMQMSAFGYISASVEGWALYAERLAAEQGWYESDPAGRLGQLHDALFRAKRLVVDTGIHAMGWSRQQAIDYGIEPSEVDRYVVWPGQACSYMIGQLRLIELRERARDALGDEFSIVDFHDVVLRTGAVPLDVLERAVNDWIAAATTGN